MACGLLPGGRRDPDPDPRSAEDLYRRLVALLQRLGRGPAGAGLGRRGRDRPVAGREPELTAGVQAFRGVLGEGGHLSARPTRRPRAWSSAPTTTSRPRSCPGGPSPARRTSTPRSPPGSRPRTSARMRVLGCRPADRSARTGPRCWRCRRSRRWRAGGPATRLARDHYVRIDSNDYSVHPSRDRPPGRGRRRPGPGRGRPATGRSSPTTNGPGPRTRPSPTPTTRAPPVMLRAPGSHRSAPAAAEVESDRCGTTTRPVRRRPTSAELRRSRDGRPDRHRPRPAQTATSPPSWRS